LLRAAVVHPLPPTLSIRIGAANSTMWLTSIAAKRSWSLPGQPTALGRKRQFEPLESRHRRDADSLVRVLRPQHPV